VTELAALLQDCYRDKLAELLRHERHARVIATYDFNNAYQYTINRDETQLTWLAKAIVDSGGTVPEATADATGDEREKDASVWRRVVGEDVQRAQSFVDKWSPLADEMTNARHRKLVRVILGETLEQKRLFEQMLAGRTDLLGRREEEVGPVVGTVLPTRWIE
jgi:hypothetical protein